MSSINRLKRELLFKLVFYGPGLGGKTTTLRHVHAATKVEQRGNLVSLATDTDRTLYFDFLPVRLLKLGDMVVKLQLYTVPGQVYYAATRKLVLSGADGVVFVADTQTARLDSNLESLEDLNSNLAEQGRKLSGTPHVFQWNKRDLTDLTPLDELDRRLNLFGAPSIATVATTGDGVFEVLERITRLVVDGYRADLPAPSSTAKKDEGPLFLDAEEVGLADAIKQLADSMPASSHGSSAQRGPGASPISAGSPGSPVAAGSPGSPARSPSPGRAPSAAHTRATLTPVPEDDYAFTLAELWPDADRDAVRRAERALGKHDFTDALAACEDLLASVFADGAELSGAPMDPASLLSLLGLDGARYLAFRAAARLAPGRAADTQRAQSEAAESLRQALESYTFVTEARRALDRASKLFKA
jgi:signal recognition particle receptor subunit beta